MNTHLGNRREHKSWCNSLNPFTVECKSVDECCDCTLILSEEVYRQLDQGIQELVRALNQFGIKTISSCEGHEHPLIGKEMMDGVDPYPRIILDMNGSHPAAILELVRRLGIFNRIRPDYPILSEFRWALLPVWGSMFYEDHSMVSLEPEERNASRSPVILQKLQQSAITLAVYLLDD